MGFAAIGRRSGYMAGGEKNEETDLNYFGVGFSSILSLTIFRSLSQNMSGSL